MGIICLYVLIQKSGQKTAKSHLCAVLKFGVEKLVADMSSYYGN